MSREFKCSKCESTNVLVRLKDYTSHFAHDERVPEFLQCTCKTCGNNWREDTSDKKE